jgi:hypothetical protein
MSKPVTSSLLKVPNCVRSTFERRGAKTDEKLQSGKCLFLPVTKCGVAKGVTYFYSTLSLLFISVFKGLNNVIYFMSDLSTAE